jgi:putative hydrolase of the HAD superfamily
MILSLQNFTTIFFDLDDTLYPPSSGLWEQISLRISHFMQEKLNLPKISIPAIREELYGTYGTTMRGLQARYNINTQDFLSFVHDVPISEILDPDPRIRRIINNCPLKKFIFTNADSIHAQNVLSALNLLDCFDDIIDIQSISPYCKPMPPAYEIACQISGEKYGKKCIMLDDKVENLFTAKQFGFYTILVGGTGSIRKCDATIQTISDLPQALPFCDEI